MYDVITYLASMCVGMGEGGLHCSGCGCATYLSTDPPTNELPLKLAAVRFEPLAEPALLLVTDRQAETQAHTHTHTHTHTTSHTHAHTRTRTCKKSHMYSQNNTL